jgi:two-component system sensor histidine kinase YesM
MESAMSEQAKSEDLLQRLLQDPEVQQAREDDFEKLPMPKIVLQPIAENAIRHGFGRTGGIMRVCVKGFRDDRGCGIEVSDNGEGFAPDVLDMLKAQMEEIRMGRYRPENSASIGGMGLVNTFARLYYFYGDRCRMLLENSGCGARVTIVIPRGEEDGKIDPYIDCGR